MTSKWDPLHKVDLWSVTDDNHTQISQAYVFEDGDEGVIKIKVHDTQLPDHWPTDLSGYELFASKRKVTTRDGDDLTDDDTYGQAEVTKTTHRVRHTILHIPDYDQAPQIFTP